MMRKESRLDRMAGRVMDLDSPAYGDERERALFMEAGTFGLSAGLYIGLLGAVIASLFGLVLLPVTLLAVTLLPASAASWYAKRRGVDLQELAEKAGARSAMTHLIVFGAAILLIFAALTYTVFAGEPVLPAPSLEVTPGQGALGGAVQGGVVGGLIGGLAAIVAGLISLRRAKGKGAAGE